MAYPQVLRNRNFVLLWLGQGTSWLGDQFRWIAVPWLVLQLSHDPLALGVVLALGGVPQAALMLVGGAVTDRFSPRAIMLLSDGVRLILSALLAVLTLTGAIRLEMLYLFEFLYGLVSGLFTPASGSMMPVLVEREQLATANSISQGTLQLTTFAGPALAGGLIAAFGRDANTGIGLAFALDALTFFVSAFTLWFIRAPRFERGPVPAQNVLAAIRDGLALAWRDPFLRLLFTVILANNLILTGAWSVGIPLLADTRLAGGAAAFGSLWAAFGAGSLLGVVLSGNLRFLRASDAGLLTLLIASAGTLALAFAVDAPVALAIMFVNGVGGGYINVLILTLLQRGTPPAYLGRIMSLLYLSSLGAAPLSKAVAGGVGSWSLAGLFAGAGVLLLLVGVWLRVQPTYRIIDQAAS